MMDNTEVGSTMLAIKIGLAVAIFLFKTGLTLKAIELCQECSILLNNGGLGTDSPVAKSFRERIRITIKRAWFTLWNSPGFKEYHMELLLHAKTRFIEAKNYFELALSIMKTTGNRQGEAVYYRRLGKLLLSSGKHNKGKECLEKAIQIDMQLGNKRCLAVDYEELLLFYKLGKYEKAREYLERALTIQIEIGDRSGEASSCRHLGILFRSLRKYEKAREYLEKELAIRKEIGDTNGEAMVYGDLGTLFRSLGKYEKAREYLEKALTVEIEIGDRNGEASTYGKLGNLFKSLGKYEKAREYLEKALTVQIEIGDRNGQASNYGNLGTLFLSLSNYEKAREYLEKALPIQIEIGDRNGEVSSCECLGLLFQSLGKYEKAREYLEKALTIFIETGDRDGEATSYIHLGTLFRSISKYEKAREYLEKALPIQIEIGQRDGEASTYVKLGILFQTLGKYEEAREYVEKALTIQTEIKNRYGEACAYGELGSLFKSLGKYEKAREYLEKALTIQIEIGDRNGEAVNYGNLGTLFRSLCNYEKAREYLEKALTIQTEIGSRNDEAANYGNLGNLFQSLGKYEKARNYMEKALNIKIEIGDRYGEALNYGNLGVLFTLLGKYEKAQEYLEKALTIQIEIGDRVGQVNIYGNLAATFLCLGKYGKVEEFVKKAAPIWREIGDREGEAIHFRNLGKISQKRGEYNDALKYYKKALKINMEIGRKDDVVVNYEDIGTCFQSIAKYDMAEENLKKALTLSRDIGHKFYELHCLCSLSAMKVSLFDLEEAHSFLFQSIEVFDILRSYLENSDELRTSLLETHGTFPYDLLSWLLSRTGKPQDALYVEELRRARGLADLMAARYCVTEKQMSGDPQSWCGIEHIVAKETDCVCLYISVGEKDVRYWILKPTGAILFTKEKVSLEKNEKTGFVPDLNEFFTENFRGLGILPEQNCEDRSLDDTESMSLQYENRTLLRECDDKHIKKKLDLCYKIIIAPVVDLLTEPEIIIVPDSCMYQIPFTALTDEEGKYLSESFKLRIVPSLTTLKRIQDSPPQYHDQTGALIVGDPKEAEMLGRLLGVKPLIGEHATKQAVLQVIHSVSLIHLAAHGNAERGEIVLSPDCPPDCVPRDEVYLLTMADISRLKLRAKLVVLSCCHSAGGQIKAEGVIGIARAFLGAGARSVLAARWALDDTATEKFMTCFYKQLYRGESASESLHEARKWMRNNGFEEVSKWASFMLIGDNVTFDFGIWPQSPTTK
ncbi:Tetratricopeptide repeat protein 28 [Stylophora pistillata]|uniref:Tetratricopeptide repeat protein 28 n=1 Tax=Stylophora pistillata TaxID=50429 RepID=A0A2B4R774_STYPI|nr:Tetratricopeptide repeat protein 28 [Stylophora pistillata]